MMANKHFRLLLVVQSIDIFSNCRYKMRENVQVEVFIHVDDDDDDDDAGGL
jgi:hypothetical protein